MLEPNDRLHFIHIPKTAGTTLISLLDARFAEDEICPAQLWREFLRLPQEEIPSYRLFRGHFGGGGVRAFLSEDPVWVTMLRDPAALALSTYKFIRREPGTRKHSSVVAPGLSFAEFIADPNTEMAVSNKQVRNLSLELDHVPGRGPVFPDPVPRAEVDRWVREHRVRVSDEERFDRAIARLEGCACCGLVERFDESMALIAYTFRWPPSGPVQRLRVAAGGSGDLTDELRERLHERNAHDEALYAHAERRFDERLAAMKRDLAALARPGEPGPEDPEQLQRLLDRHYRRDLEGTEPEPVPALRLGFDAPLPGSGWQRREVAPADGTLFRWTGPGSVSTLDLPIDRSHPLRITLRIIDAVEEETIDDVRVTADGEGLDMTTIDGAGRCRVLQGTVPARDDPPPFTRLELRVARTQRLRSAHTLNPDERELGVAVNWIDLAPLDARPAGEVPADVVDHGVTERRRQRRRGDRVRRIGHRVAALPIVGPWIEGLHRSGRGG